MRLLPVSGCEHNYEKAVETVVDTGIIRKEIPPTEEIPPSFNVPNEYATCTW